MRYRNIWTSAPFRHTSSTAPRLSSWTSGRSRAPAKASPTPAKYAIAASSTPSASALSAARSVPLIWIAFCDNRLRGLTCALSSIFIWFFQIVGTSKNFLKIRRRSPEKKAAAMAASESEDSYSSSSSSHGRSAARFPSFTPSTPPRTAANLRSAKRRKGIPHRSPMGGLMIEI